ARLIASVLSCLATRESAVFSAALRKGIDEAFLKRMMMKKLFRFAALLYFASPLLATSYFTDRLDDPRAVFLTPDKFPVRGDGIVDDSDALQQAIDKVQETTNQGILFVPSGRYRLSRTVYIWPGIRLIGYGKTRPVLVLGANTPAFQTGPSYLIFFAGR